MRWSKLFIPTLREAPAQAEAASHRLLTRAGYIRQLTSGVYSLLPMAQRVRLKIINIIRQEMNSIGGQEFLLSALQPLELWEESGRVEAVADVMFCLQDRKSSKLALGLTHEEVFTSIARAGLISYKQLPQIWYQIQTKFRDETRPKGGLLRVREFTMKDSYSFDVDEPGLDRAFQSHHDAYVRIFSRCGLPFKAVEASSGAMGGSRSIEFMALTPSGEDTLVLCSNCGYAANLEKAQSRRENHEPDTEDGPLKEFATPGIRTIKALEEFGGGAPARDQIKTLVYAADGALILALVRGDQELNLAKLESVAGAGAMRPATESEIVAALGARPGSLGACGVIAGNLGNIREIVADLCLKGRVGMMTGANRDDLHFSGVNVDRDIAVGLWADLCTVGEGDLCINCGHNLNLTNGLEIGHIFKLGTRYSDAMNAKLLGPSGDREPVVMGSYGLGVERLLAAIAELSHDEKGLKWPLSVAPFAVLITPVNSQDSQQMAAAERIHECLTAVGVDCLLDDREERAGVKFNDGDLIGVPFRVTVGRKIGQGIVELTDRQAGASRDLTVDELVDELENSLSRVAASNHVG